MKNKKTIKEVATIYSYGELSISKLAKIYEVSENVIRKAIREAIIFDLVDDFVVARIKEAAHNRQATAIATRKVLSIDLQRRSYEKTRPLEEEIAEEARKIKKTSSDKYYEKLITIRNLKKEIDLILYQISSFEYQTSSEFEEEGFSLKELEEKKEYLLEYLDEILKGEKENS